MPESSEEWFARYLARQSLERKLQLEARPKKKKRKHRPKPKKVYCKKCGYRKVAKGPSQSSRSAAKRDECTRCYNSAEPGAPRRRYFFSKYGTCWSCNIRGVPEGGSANARYARKHGLCKKCHQAGIRKR